MFLYVCSYNADFAESLRSSDAMMMSKQKRDKQVYYVVPIASIRGNLPVVPIGDTGTVPFSMRERAKDFVDAAFDSSEGSGDGSWFWFVNTIALHWARAK